MYINVQRFRGGLVFKAHRLLYYSILGTICTLNPNLFSGARTLEASRVALQTESSPGANQRRSTRRVRQHSPGSLTFPLPRHCSATVQVAIDSPGVAQTSDVEPCALNQKYSKAGLSPCLCSAGIRILPQPKIIHLCVELPLYLPLYKSRAPPWTTAGP